MLRCSDLNRNTENWDTLIGARTFLSAWSKRMVKRTRVSALRLRPNDCCFDLEQLHHVLGHCLKTEIGVEEKEIPSVGDDLAIVARIARVFGDDLRIGKH